jgi:TraM recognition site of TraD and TraG
MKTMTVEEKITEIVSLAQPDSREQLEKALRACAFTSPDDPALHAIQVHAILAAQPIRMVTDDNIGVATAEDMARLGAFGLGSSDSGKTSGMVQFFTAAVMEAGYGVLCLTAKETPPDVDFFKEIIKKTGRENSTVLIGPNHGLGFNILRYEMEAAQDGPMKVDLGSNVGSLMFAIVDTVIRSRSQQDATIWRAAGEGMLTHISTVVYASTGDQRLDDFRAVIGSLPQSMLQTVDPTWQRTSRCWELVQKALLLKPSDRNVLLAKDYLLSEFPTLPSDTRNSVVFTLKASGLDLFCREPLYSMFFSRTDYTPQILCDGAILICDCSVGKYRQVGKIANAILRLTTQRMLDRRGKVDDGRPIAICWDEAQKTLTDSDAAFQESARSTRCAVIGASQNIPTIKKEVGPDLTDAFLGHFSTRIFFQNSDADTNEHMSEKCGEKEVKRTSTTSSPDGKISTTTHTELMDVLPPDAALKLKTGGPDNGYIVEAFLISKFLLRRFLRLKFHQRKLRRWFGTGCVSVVARRRPAPDFCYLRRGP